MLLASRNSLQIFSLLETMIIKNMFCFANHFSHDHRCTNQQPPQRGGAVPDPVWVGSKWLLTSRESQLPRALLHFLPCCPLNDRSRAARSFFKIGRLSSLFSCPSLARLRILILLLLMSGDVHPNPGPIYPRLECAGDVAWLGRSVQ